MKKLISTFLTVALLICCFTATAFASNQTVLTTTVPDATYTLNIPADQEIGFGQTTSDIGMVTISDASGFAAGKNVKVSINYDEFSSDSVDTKIPFRVYGKYSEYSPSSGTSSTAYDYYDDGHTLTFEGQADGGVSNVIWATDSYYYDEDDKIRTMGISIGSSDWGKALGGDYTATITFTSEVVSSNQ